MNGRMVARRRNGPSPLAPAVGEVRDGLLGPQPASGDVAPAFGDAAWQPEATTGESVGTEQPVDRRHHDGASHGAGTEHGVEDAEGELIETEFETADHRQQRADGDAGHEEAETAGENRLE